MAERRPFPPSPRRLALARASGLSATSPILVGGSALAAAIAVIFGVARTATGRLGADIAAAASAADGSLRATASATNGAASSDFAHHAATGASSDVANGASTVVHTTSSHVGRGASTAADTMSSSVIAERAASIVSTVLDIALPLLVAAALAALVVHVAQTRTLWFPRRSLPGAPTLPRRTRIGADTLGAVAIAGTAFGWLWLCAARIALLMEQPAGVAAALLALLVTLAIAWVVLGVGDALVRHVQLADALSMSREDKREDDRLSAADPRWRAQRLAVMRGPAIGDAVARSAVVLAGDDIAVAIDWDAVRQPVPLRSTTGRGARASQLLALARRHRVAIHRDDALARLLVGGEGPVPEEHWARLAEIVAAVGGRRT